MIAMKFTIELDIGLSFLLRRAPNRNPKGNGPMGLSRQYSNPSGPLKVLLDLSSARNSAVGSAFSLQLGRRPLL